jgi:hypothetical protein
MDRNGSITTERPFNATHKNQIQLRSFFFSLCIALHRHPILMSALAATPERFVNASDLLSDPLLLLPQSFLFRIPPVSLCSLLPNIGQRHITVAVTRQLYTLVYVLIFFVFLPLLRQPFLHSSCASRAGHPRTQFSTPTSLLQPLSRSLIPRTSSVDTMCVFKHPSSSWRALYRIPVFSTQSDPVNLCHVLARPYL